MVSIFHWIVAEANSWKLFWPEQQVEDLNNATLELNCHLSCCELEDLSSWTWKVQILSHYDAAEWANIVIAKLLLHDMVFKWATPVRTLQDGSQGLQVLFLSPKKKLWNCHRVILAVVGCHVNEGNLGCKNLFFQNPTAREMWCLQIQTQLCFWKLLPLASMCLICFKALLNCCELGQRHYVCMITQTEQLCKNHLRHNFTCLRRPPCTQTWHVYTDIDNLRPKVFKPL